MLQLQLYIEGQQIEMFKDESITLTQNITDVKELDAVLTDYSRTFTVPASKNNNKVFQHYYDYNIEGFDAKIKKAAVLNINYKTFKKGKIRFEGVSLKNNKPENYRLTFFGDTIKLTDSIGDDQLSSLNELSAFDFDYNDTNVAAYMSDGLDNNIGADQIDDAIIIPLITHTNRLTFDSSKNEIYNLHPSIGTDDNGVPFSELKPAIRIHALIVAIEMHYDIAFSQDFFNTTNLAYYNLYMWLHTKPGPLFQDQNKSKQFKGYSLTGGQTDIDELNIRSNNFALNNSKKRIVFNLGFTVDPGDDTIEYSLIIKKNGEEFKRFEGLTGDTKNGTALGQSIDLIEVKNGEFSVYIETSATTTFGIKISVQRKNNAFLGGKKDSELNTSLTTVSGSTFTVAANLPEIKTIDFLQGLFKMFNLVAYYEDETIVVTTLDDFYASSTKTHDVTRFVDSTKSQVDSPIPFRQVNLSYEKNETFLAKNFESINNKSWGTVKYNEDSYILVDGQRDKNDGETYEIKIPFEHMLFERLHNAHDDSITQVQWGWHVDEKEQKSSGKPLLFYPIKTFSSISARNLSGSKVTISSPYMPSNSLFVFSDYVEQGMSQSLNFHFEIDEFSRVPNEKTLFKTYYETYVKDLFDPRKRITKLSAELPLKIHETLSLADDLKIFDKIYRINSITTNFETGKSELELTNILNTATVLTSILKALDIFDIASLGITVDNTLITADQDNQSGGFTLPAIVDSTPAPIIQNQISNNTIDPCDVTVASISDPRAIGSSTTIQFIYDITSPGTICDVDNIDEYGFLISSTLSDLTATDSITALKGNSNVTLINTVRQTGEPPLQSGTQRAMITSLTHSATRHARFYVITNNDPNLAEANVISPVFTGLTDTGAGTSTSSVKKFFWANNAGLRTDAGYNTIPTKAQIEANTYTQFHQGTCGSYTESPLNWIHNGSNLYPKLNDRVTRKQVAGVPNYTGGTNSFDSIYGQTTYFAVSVGDLSDNYLKDGNSFHKVIKQIVIEYSTAKVVAVYDCAGLATPLVGALLLTSFYAELQSNIVVCNTDYTAAMPYNWTVGAKVPQFGIAHNGSEVNPETGDQIMFTHANGTALSGNGFNGDVTNFGGAGNIANFNTYDFHILVLVDENNIAKGGVSINKGTGLVLNTFYCD